MVSGIWSGICNFAGDFEQISALMLANAVAVLFIGIAGALQKMYVLGGDGRLESTGTMMLIASLAIGAVAGELINLEDRIEQFGEWLKAKTGKKKYIIIKEKTPPPKPLPPII